MIPNPQDQPTLSVDEAARAYGIGRSAAYDQCRRWLTTNGKSGIPALRFGRLIRCPTAAVRAQLGIDPARDTTSGFTPEVAHLIATDATSEDHSDHTR